ncbi:MAG: L-threonylcarbamoyladenylate synthase [Acidimicrobiales bacterium]
MDNVAASGHAEEPSGKVVCVQADDTDAVWKASRQAAAIIRSGGLVSFPTETVYGLGADATNPVAIDRIYRVKQRPVQDPLIVHISSLESIEAIFGQVSPLVMELAMRFWPGPLTVVLHRSEEMIAPQVSGGRPTVAVRMPDHPVPLAIIEAAGVPLAAPSANRFGRVSPTCADDVVADLGNEVDMIIDAGPTRIGVESTVIDMTVEKPVILRPGGITIEELRQILPQVEYSPREVDSAPAAPGRYLRHYAPSTPMVVVARNDRRLLYSIARELSLRGIRVVIMGGAPGQDHQEYKDAGRDPVHKRNQEQVSQGKGTYGVSTSSPVNVTGTSSGVYTTEQLALHESTVDDVLLDNNTMPGNAILVLDQYDVAGMARNLYRMLRLADSQEAGIILAGALEDKGVGVAVNDRLFRAASGRVIVDASPTSMESLVALATSERSW